MTDDDVIHCDALGCRETHPVRHEDLGKPGFGIGRWLGWLYLDLNRPDLRDRPLRFCSTWCLRSWLILIEENATPPSSTPRRTLTSGEGD